jgi:hypothetical protein
MVYSPEPPYTVQQTGVIDAKTVARFARFARYWDLLANSGRFTQTLTLLLHQSAGSTPFWRFMAFADWLWLQLGATHKLTPEVLVDALLDYLSQPGRLPADLVRQALLADYIASGARANPRALQGLLPRQCPAQTQVKPTLVSRQSRHLSAQ